MVGLLTPKGVREAGRRRRPVAPTEDENHIKAPPSTSEVVGPSEVGWGRLLASIHQPRERGFELTLSGEIILDFRLF